MTTIPLPAGTVRHAGGCIQPVLPRGRVDHIDGATIDGATGELLHRYSTVHEPGGDLPLTWEPPWEIEPQTYALRARFHALLAGSKPAFA